MVIHKIKGYQFLHFFLMWKEINKSNFAKRVMI